MSPRTEYGSNAPAFQWTDLAKDLVRNLLYFEVFSYPVSDIELWETCTVPCAELAEIRAELNKMVAAGLVCRHGDWYCTQGSSDWAVQRAANNRRAQKYLHIAQKVGPWIGAFPYVRAVFVSGSLSKGVMPEDGDIDYFVVTRPGRLWVARTMLVLFKKLFLLNSKKYWCVNYFVDENHLVIEEQNRFTATEVVTLLPVYGADRYGEFMARNPWTQVYYPKFPLRGTHLVPLHRARWGKKIAERLLDSRLGAWLDERCMRATVKHWKSKFGGFSEEEFAVAMKSRKYVSKHHPQHFQRRVLDRYAVLLEQFGRDHGVGL
jgi:hypothetical protein